MYQRGARYRQWDIDGKKRIVGARYFKTLRDLRAGNAFAYVPMSDARFQKNPAPRYDSRNLEGARDLYERFTGHKGKTLLTMRKPVIPDEGLVVGKILGIMYETVRDGRQEKYRHMFARKSRPLFVVSHDGRQLLMLGGAYDFTERGIVDRK